MVKLAPPVNAECVRQNPLKLLTGGPGKQKHLTLNYTECLGPSVYTSKLIYDCSSKIALFPV